MRTPLRLKLLSLKPNKQQLILGRVTVSVETTAAAVPPAALNNSTSSANKIAVSNFTADATTAGGGTASTGISASMTSSEQLSGILRTAMLQIDTKVMIKIHTFFHVSCTRAPLYSLVYLLLVRFFFFNREYTFNSTKRIHFIADPCGMWSARTSPQPTPRRS